MDGKVNFFDVTQMLGYKYNTGQAASYTDGDLNYDGKVNFLDLTVILSSNYNTGQIYVGAASVEAARGAGVEVVVPEPASLGLIAFGAAASMCWACQRRRWPAR